MNIATLSRDWTKALTTNSTDASFDSLIPTVTEPVGDGVVSVATLGQTENNVIVILYGTGNADTTFSHRLTGWTHLGTLWVPSPIIEIAATLGTAVGVSGELVANTEKFVDTITKTAGPSTAELLSPADNRIAWYMIDSLGFEKLEFGFDMTGATNANALFRCL